MALIPLKFPPGLMKNGTELDASGRWIDSNLCRWHDDTMKPIGGWRQRTSIVFEDIIRGMITWKALNGSRYIALGNYKNIFALFPSGDLYDITPTGFVAGREDATGMTGYGSSFYNSGIYSAPPISTSSTLLPATSIHFSTFGEQLIFCSRDDGRVYYWDLNPNNIGQEITGASDPANSYTNDNKGCIVSDERFLFCFTSKKVKWSDQENYNTWASTSTNQAGNIDLQTNGEFITSQKIRGGILIITTTDAHATRFIGQPFVHSIQRVGENCGAYSALSSATIDKGVVWWGDNGFFIYSGGRVQELPCMVQDYLTDNLTIAQKSKVAAVTNSKFDEVTWYYPGLNKNECSEYVTWNYKNNSWYIGGIGRTSGVDRGVFEYPLKASAKRNDGTYPLQIREGADHYWMEVFFEPGVAASSASPTKDPACATVGNLLRTTNRINTGQFGNPTINSSTFTNWLDTSNGMSLAVSMGHQVKLVSGTLYETFTYEEGKYFHYKYPSGGSRVPIYMQIVGLDENGAPQTSDEQYLYPNDVFTSRLDGYRWTKITEINLRYANTSGDIDGLEFSIGGDWDSLHDAVILESVNGRAQITPNGAFSKFIKIAASGRNSVIKPNFGWMEFRQSSGALHTLGANASEQLGTMNKGLLGVYPCQILEHEVGFERNNIIPFAESAPFQIGNGDNIMHVTQVIADEKSVGDVGATFKTKLYPNGVETTQNTVNFANPTDVRFSGRQAKMRIFQNVNTDWRLGTVRLEARPGGKR